MNSIVNNVRILERWMWVTIIMLSAYIIADAFESRNKKLEEVNISISNNNSNRYNYSCGYDAGYYQSVIDTYFQVNKFAVDQNPETKKVTIWEREATFNLTDDKVSDKVEKKK